MARIWRIDVADAEQLTDDEFMQFSFFLLPTFHIMETIVIQYELGTVELRAWQGERRTIDNIFNSPGVQYWWQQNPYSFTTEFRDFLEQEIYRSDQVERMVWQHIPLHFYNCSNNDKNDKNEY